LSAPLFLFLYQIWGRLSTTVQVTLLVGAPLVAVVATEIAHRLDRTRHFVFVAAVIACACIVMNVALVGEIFAMTDSPNALAVWAAFALMTATLIAPAEFKDRLPKEDAFTWGSLQHEPRFAATLAVGRRYEPWIVAIEPFDTPSTPH
jgi:NAD/NADP transhydrogenase beta subunit